MTFNSRAKRKGSYIVCSSGILASGWGNAYLHWWFRVSNLTNDTESETRNFELETASAPELETAFTQLHLIMQREPENQYFHRIRSHPLAWFPSAVCAASPPPLRPLPMVQQAVSSGKA